jgi:hypothetical protein
MNRLYSRFLFFLFFVLLSGQTMSQQLHHQMLSSMGSTSVASNGLIVLQTVGQQSVVGTKSSSNLLIQQGFQHSMIAKYFPFANLNKVTTIIYPNPFKDKVTVNFSEMIPGDMTVDLYNMFGVVIFKYRVKDSPLTMSYNFDYLSSGSYVLQIKAANYLFTKTLIKQ